MTRQVDMPSLLNTCSIASKGQSSCSQREGSGTTALAFLLGSRLSRYAMSLQNPYVSLQGREHNSICLDSGALFERD
jgi:hypothetical protein